MRKSIKWFRKNNLILPFVLFLPLFLFPQTNRYSVSSSKDNLSYHWNGLFAFKQTQKAWIYQILLTGTSRTFNQSQITSTSVDEINGQFKIGRPVAKKIQFRSEVSLKKYTNQNVNLSYNKTVNENLLTFSPSVNLSVSPVAGAIFEDKYNNFESGTVLGWNTGFTTHPQTTTTLSGSHISRFYNFRERKNKLHQINVTYLSTFPNKSVDSLYAGYSYQHHTEYINENLDAEDIRISNMSVGNTLHIPLGKTVNLVNITEFRRREFIQERTDRDNTRLENQVANTMAIKMETPRFKWHARVLNLYQINDFEDRNSSTLLDNNSIQFALENMVMYSVNSHNTIGLRLNYAKLEYSTPDSINNNDDRDEFRFTGEFSWISDFTKNSQLEVKTGIRRFHQIYIEKEKSGLNKVEQEIYVRNRYQWHYGALENSFSTGVNAYYLNYDFEKILNSIGNIANRQWSIADTVLYHFTQSSAAVFSVRHMLEEIGNLDWKKFVEQVIRKNYYNYYVLFLRHQLQNGLRLQEGFSYITREDYNMVPVKNRVRNYINKIMWLELKFKLSAHGFVNGRLSKYIYSNIGDIPSSYFKGNLEVIWIF